MTATSSTGKGKFNGAKVLLLLWMAAATLIGMDTLFQLCGGFAASPRDFDAEQWRAGDAKLRGSMVRDLLGVPDDTSYGRLHDKDANAGSILHQMSRAKILVMLGPPKGFENEDEYDHEGSLVYDVGQMGQRGFLVGRSVLIIDFHGKIALWRDERREWNKDLPPKAVFVGR